MQRYPFFDHTNFTYRLFFGVVFLPFCGFLIFITFLNQELEPFPQTIAAFMSLWSAFIVLHKLLWNSTIYVDQASSSIKQVKGYPFLKRTKSYLLSDIKSIEIRSISNTQSTRADGTYSVSTSYYAVLILDDDEIYLDAGRDFDEAKMQVKKLCSTIAKPYHIALYKQPKIKGSSVARILRVLFLLLVALIGMLALFLYFSEGRCFDTSSLAQLEGCLRWKG